MEAQALARLFDALGASLVVYARQLAPSGVAEDLVQEAFIRLAGQRDAPGNPRAWLVVAIRNGAVDALRARRRLEGRGRQLREERLFVSSSPDPLAVEEAQQALAALPLEEREVITLRLWNDVTFEEIAALMGMPLSTVYSRYKSGLEQIRARWEAPCRNR
jgi:RNA polymerase sigma-70 factor (ECF subfamily)